MRTFVDKWKEYEDRDDLPRALENQILEENPVNVDLLPELAQNRFSIHDCAEGDQPVMKGDKVAAVFSVDEENTVVVDL